MSALVCPVVVGREIELADLAQILRDAVGGNGSAAFVLGEAGIGKTRLADAAREQAEALGMRVVQGRAVEGGEQVPFRPLAEAFQAAFRKEGRLPGAVSSFSPVVGKVVPQWAQDRPVAETNPVLLFEAIVQLIGVMGERSGALMILEDLHWADAETLSAVEYLADQLETTRVACLVTARTDEPVESGRTVARIAARFSPSRFDLQRLTEPLVEEMAKQTLGEASPPPELLSAVAERSEGVPLLVEELLSAYSAPNQTGVPARLEALPSSYAMVIEQRLALLDQNARDVVEAAAAIGSDFHPELLSAVTDLTEESVLEALRSCLHSNLLLEHVVDGSPTLVFRHAMVADAVVTQLLPTERLKLYARVADAIQELFPGLSGEWCNRVAELRLKTGDSQRAADHLIEAGRRALKRGALLTAEHALERARLLVKGDRWKTTGVDRVLVRVLSLLGNIERLRELGDSAISFMKGVPDLLGSPERQGEVLLEIARGMVPSRDWESVHLRMKPVVALAEGSAVEEFRVRVRSLVARVALERGELDAAEVASSEVLIDAERLGVIDSICEAKQVKSGLALARNDLAGAANLLREAKLYAERRDLTLWRVEILLDLAAIDEARTASLENILAARELVGRTEAPLTQARVDLQLARTRLARFELDLADEALRGAIELCRRYQLPLLRETLAVKAQAAALGGDSSLLRACAKEADGLPVTPADQIAFYEANVILKVVRGDLNGAREELGEAAELIAEDRRERPRWLGEFWVLTSLLGGDSYDLPEWASPTHPFLRLADAIRLGMRGESGSAAETFESADRELVSFPWRRNVARRIVAEAALRDSWGHPTSWLAEAAAFFDSTGQAGLASACRGLLRRAGVAVPRRGRGKVPVPESLRSVGITSREMDVLDLVGEGLSNNEIAERLYISVRTVESHVASSMRKIGVGSRPQLIARLLDEPVGSIEPKLE